MATTAVTGGAVPLIEALAAVSGQPVLVMAGRALVMAAGWRRLAGGLGLVAWAGGVHWSQGRCEIMSLVVAGAGLQEVGWGAPLVMGAAWCWPAFPEQPGQGMPMQGFTSGGPLVSGEQWRGAGDAGGGWKQFRHAGVKLQLAT
jgi:hypothetical protein